MKVCLTIPLSAGEIESGLAVPCQEKVVEIGIQSFWGPSACDC